MTMKTTSVQIKTEYITLGQLLKFAGIIDLGSEEKSYLATHKVLVNDEPENRRGKKIRPGDRVTLEDLVLEVEAR